MQRFGRMVAVFSGHALRRLGVLAVTLTAVFANSRSARAQLAEPSVSVPVVVDESRPAFNILRYNEDWSVLSNPKLRTDRLDRIKYIPLSAEHPSDYVSVGGEFRGTYEHVLNDNFTQQPYPNYSFGMQRFQLFADAHVNPHFRFFVQLESGLEEGRAGGPRVIDAKRLDFLNAFVDLKPSTNLRSPSIRVGRQELNFGSGRLVAVREGPNVRQSFYGFDVREKTKNWTVDGIAVRPAQDNHGYFDNVPLHTTQFWGVFATRSLSNDAGKALDAYYFGIDRKNAVFNSGTARELRHTVGARLVSPAPVSGARNPFIPHYDLEAAYQFGEFGTRSIQAWTVSGEAGYILHSVPFSPHLGIRADISSGDKGNSNKALGTFNPLFPVGNYFGVISDTGPGPVNFRDLHPDARFTLPHGWSIDADWVFYWRQSLQDGVYGVPGNLLVSTPQTQARFVGNRPGAEVRWQITRHAYIQADYGVFFAGDFLKAAGRDHNLNYASTWVGYKF